MHSSTNVPYAPDLLSQLKSPTATLSVPLQYSPDATKPDPSLNYGRASNSGSIKWANLITIDDSSVHSLLRDNQTFVNNDSFDSNFLMALDLEQYLLTPSTDNYDDLTLDLGEIADNNNTVQVANH